MVCHLTGILRDFDWDDDSITAENCKDKAHGGGFYTEVFARFLRRHVEPRTGRPWPGHKWYIDSLYTNQASCKLAQDNDNDISGTCVPGKAHLPHSFAFSQKKPTRAVPRGAMRVATTGDRELTALCVMDRGRTTMLDTQHGGSTEPILRMTRIDDEEGRRWEKTAVGIMS